MQAVYLTPRSTFPAAYPSNTLFGAICTGLFDLGYDVDGLIGRYPEDPPFILSSAFPYVTAGGRIHHFLPCPLLPPLDLRREEDFDNAKRFKKVRYLHEDLFRDLASGDLRGDVLVWHTKTGSRYHRLSGAGACVKALSFDDGDRVLRVACSDGTVRFWTIR